MHKYIQTNVIRQYFHANVMHQYVHTNMLYVNIFMQMLCTNTFTHMSYINTTEECFSQANDHINNTPLLLFQELAHLEHLYHSQF